MNKSDTSSYFSHLLNVVTDLFSAWCTDPDMYVGYSRGKKNFKFGGSYWDFSNGASLLRHKLYLNSIDFLSSQDYIENHVAAAGINPISSRMRAKAKLIDLLQKMEINWANVQTNLSNSFIVVKDENKRVVPPPNDTTFDLDRAESNLRRINENLQTSLLNLDITDKEFEALRKRLRQPGNDENELLQADALREPLDFSNRSIKRIFALGSFENGGRFYGGWWQGLPKEYRKHIQIEGCITREMDFSTIQPRILYAKAGAKPPRDSYTVEGWDPTLRDLTKKAFNQLVNSSERTRDPNQWHLFAPNLYPDPLPGNWDTLNGHQKAVYQKRAFKDATGRDYTQLLHDLKAVHAPIDDYFFSQSWTWLQRIDSDIAELVMLKLLDQQYTALPIHDSFIVRRGAEGALMKTMEESFEEVVGSQGKIDKNPAIYDHDDQDNNKPSVVAMSDLYQETLDSMTDRTGYHKREYEWRMVWGPSGYE